MNTYQGGITAGTKKFGIVVSRFNEFITNRLLESALMTLEQAGAKRNAVEVVWVPGALEVPQFCRALASARKVDVVIALACVIRGGTYHYECVANELTRGISQVALEFNVPIATGVITCDNLEQAIDRAGLKSGNKGAQAAMAALEIANLKSQLSLKKGKKRSK